ncbi:MAG: hypothetical protein RQ760_17440 [Sedimentisphaerales bacterium]|nr:hypothetical protein [Sedimentisphaerales bacterium]
MFNGKETIQRKITIAILTVVSLSFCTPVFAQQRDFANTEDNFGNFLLNALANIEVITDLSKGISLYDIPTPITVIEQADIQQPVQKTNPEIPLTITAVNLTDDDLHKLGSATLGLNNSNPQKPNLQEVIISSNSDELVNTEELKLKNTRLIDAILASEQNMTSVNPLMNLVWQIDENMDFAIVGQYQLDMEYPDFIEYLKNDVENQTKSALYAKLTLRF